MIYSGLKQFHFPKDQNWNFQLLSITILIQLNYLDLLTNGKLFQRIHKNKQAKF